MKPEQLLLGLSTRQRMTRAEFLPAQSNSDALNAIDHAEDWPARRMLICGPSGSGRTHLLHVWTTENDGILLNGAALDQSSLTLARDATVVAVDDANLCAGNPVREEALFHLCNQASAENRNLLIAATDTPGTWGIALPDLQSRLLSFPVTRMHRPDDELLEMVLHKLCDDFQLVIDAATIRYIVPRIERSLDVAHRVVEVLDQDAVTRQKRVSRQRAATVLSELGFVEPSNRKGVP